MAINFPHNPNINDVHTEASLGKSWKWDGTTWLIYSSSTTGIGYSDLSVSQQAASGAGSLSYNNAGIFTYTPPALTTTFLGLNDTPNAFTSNKWLKVNSGGTALEWADAPSGGGGSYTLPTASTTVLGGVKIDASTITIDGNGVISVSSSVPTTIAVTDESIDVECYPLFAKDATGNIEPKTGSNIKFNSSSGQLEAGSFKKTGGTSSEFLKADGSVDSTTYLSSNPSYALNDLSDVTTGTISDGDVLKYSGTNSRWEALPDATGGGGSSLALNDLTNVDAVTGAANGKILKYNGTSWEIADDLTGGGGSSNFTGLADTPSSLDAGKWLKVNAGATALEWTDAPSDNNTTYSQQLTVANATPASVQWDLVPSVGTADSITLTAGTNVTFSAASVDGVTINSSGGGATTLGGLTDVDTSGAADGKIIKHNGTSWEISEEIQSDWNESNANLTSYIKNKPTAFTLNQVLSAGNTSTLNATFGDITCDDLTVSGTTTTINTATLSIADNLITLNSDYSGSSPTENAGIEVQRGTEPTAMIRWNETSDKWQFTNDGTNFSDIGASGGEANVQVDWNQTTTSADDYIKNKPTLFSGAYSDLTGKPTLFSGAYGDLTGKPTIPAAQIQSDWNQSSTSALDFIKNKPTNILTAESDTLATVTGRGATTSTACEFGQLDATGIITAAFLNVKDPKIVLNSDFSGSGPTEDAFVRVERGSSADVNIKWDESSDKWQATNDGTNYYDLGAEAVPTGTIVMYGAGTAPSGWLLCAGQSTSGYTNLAAVVGNNVPDLRDKFVVGAGSSYNMDATGGYTDAIVVNHNHNAGNQNSNHTHAPGNSMATNFTGDHYHQQGGSGSGTTGNQSANHYHSIGANKPDGSPGVWNVTTSGGAHTHPQYRNNYSVNTPYDAHGYGRSSSSTSIAQGVNTGSTNHSHTIDLTGVTTGGIDQNHTHNFNFNIGGTTTYSSIGNHAHNINGNTGNESANHNHNINSEGSSGSGRNLPPYYALCFIIKT